MKTKGIVVKDEKILAQWKLMEEYNKGAESWDRLRQDALKTKFEAERKFWNLLAKTYWQQLKSANCNTPERKCACFDICNDISHASDMECQRTLWFEPKNNTVSLG